ncbi:MAG: tRNA (adenosine(37)-N6)-threonylcarbamoyltransferase complex ATPase subunit type 1 TsaE [Maritimibacter sp.]
MTHVFRRQIRLASPKETARLARAFVGICERGDVILLEGPIGSGKTHFCRAMIQEHLIQNNAPLEDVPSPTFTLVQTYDTGTSEIWHADLYRLTHPDEVEELGLIDAFESEICLVEWPDRLGALTPQNALLCSFEQGAEDDMRRLTLTATDPKWVAKLENALAEFPYE